MRAVVILAAFLAAGCGARTGLEADARTQAVCGDGVVQAGEACDPGGADGGVCPYYLLSQRASERRVSPVTRSRSAIAFYAYASKSAHTGFEAVNASRLFLYRDLESQSLSLFTEHGIDLESSGISQPVSAVNQRITGLPVGTFVAITDDYPEEISMPTKTTAIGTWHFEQNTDGTILSGLPDGDPFAIDIDSDFQLGVGAWAWVDGDGTLLPLDLGVVARVERRFEACGCQPDCTVPR